MALLSNQEVSLVEKEKNLYSLDFLAARPDRGAYVLEFRVIPQEKQNEYQAITSTLRRVQVAAVGLTDGFVLVQITPQNVIFREKQSLLNKGRL